MYIYYQHACGLSQYNNLHVNTMKVIYIMLQHQLCHNICRGRGKLNSRSLDPKIYFPGIYISTEPTATSPTYTG